MGMFFPFLRKCIKSLEENQPKQNQSQSATTHYYIPYTITLNAVICIMIFETKELYGR